MRVQSGASILVAAAIAVAIAVAACSSAPPELLATAAYWGDQGAHACTSTVADGAWLTSCVVQQPAADDPYSTIDVVGADGRITAIVAHLARNGSGTVDSPGDATPMSWADTVTALLGDNVEASPGGPPGLTQWVHEHPRGGETTLGDAGVRLVVGTDDATLTIQRP